MRGLDVGAPYLEGVRRKLWTLNRKPCAVKAGFVCAFVARSNAKLRGISACVARSRTTQGISCEVKHKTSRAVLPSEA